MADRIKPALTACEWRNREFTERGITFDASVTIDGDAILTAFTEDFYGDLHRPCALIALANAALPDADPRKITSGMIMDLRMIASGCRHEWGQDSEEAATLERIADALESYLPPE